MAAEEPPSETAAKAEAAEGEGSKVAESIASKGENSYYYAHGRPKDDLTSAQRIEGDGTVPVLASDGMKKLGEGSQAPLAPEKKVRWREDYSWGDDGPKAKVYVEFPEGALGRPEVKVDAKFEELSFEVLVSGAGTDGEVVGVTNGAHALSGKILPEKCSWRISSNRSRLTITLVKAEPEEGAWGTLKKPGAEHEDLLFADFIGQQHVVGPHADGWPRLTSTRCADFENVTVVVHEGG